MDASEFDAVRWSSIYYLYLYFGTEKQNRTIIIAFLKSASGKTLGTGIAHIWWFQELRTNFFVKLLAILVAGRTVTAFLVITIRIAACTYMFLLAGFAFRAGIKLDITIADFGKAKMLFDFFGYSGRIFSNSITNLSKGTFV